MSQQKIGIAIVTLALAAILSIMGCLYFSSHLLIKYLDVPANLSASISLPFELIKTGGKKVKLFAMLATITSMAFPALAFGLIGYAALAPKKRELHGSARFASRAELVDSGLLKADRPDDPFPSLVIGKTGKDFLLFRGQQFAFLAAPTRSGKGVGIVIPNLLHYRDSVVVLDIKGENFDITSGFRAKCGQKVYKFAPDSEDFLTECWNPLSYVRTDPQYRISDLMGITNILYPPSDDVWSSTAESLFLGLALYIMDTPKEHANFNIASIKKMRVSLPFLADEKSFLAYVKQRESFEPLSPECIGHLQSYAQTSDKLRSSIAISFDQPLAIFSDPITARATAKNTFDLREVRRTRMSIYVVIKPANIEKFGKFLNLFFQQLLLLNMDKLPKDDPSLKYQCLLLLDEFPAMGRVAIIEKASAYMAGYNMRLLLVFQSKSQVKDKKLYDETGAQTMLTNMALQVMYAPRDDNDAKEYSEMIGYMTEKNTSQSRSFGKNGNRSASTSDQRRAVLLPQEVKEIGADKEIISMENMRPALVDKIRWYEEPVFQRRANLEKPVVPDQREHNNTIEPALKLSLLHRALQLQSLSPNAQFEVGFSPQRNALEIVLSFITKAKQELLVAAYCLTSRQIAYALLDAHQRGTAVKIIVDSEQYLQHPYPLDALEGAGIPIKVSGNYAAMNHYFMVADGSSVQLGNFGYTDLADYCNAESAITFYNVPELADIYLTEWHRLRTAPNVNIESINKVDHVLKILGEFGVN